MLQIYHHQVIATQRHDFSANGAEHLDPATIEFFAAFESLFYRFGCHVLLNKNNSVIVESATMVCAKKHYTLGSHGLMHFISCTTLHAGQTGPDPDEPDHSQPNPVNLPRQFTQLTIIHSQSCSYQVTN